MLDIQEYIHYIIKKHKTLTDNPPIHIYINKINNRLVFKIKDKYKLELQTPERRKIFDNARKSIEKIKHGKNLPDLEVVQVVLVQCNLVDSQYQQKSGILYMFTPNKSLLI